MKVDRRYARNLRVLLRKWSRARRLRGPYWNEFEFLKSIFAPGLRKEVNLRCPVFEMMDRNWKPRKHKGRKGRKAAKRRMKFHLDLKASRCEMVWIPSHTIAGRPLPRVNHSGPIEGEFLVFRG